MSFHICHFEKSLTSPAVNNPDDAFCPPKGYPSDGTNGEAIIPSPISEPSPPIVEALDSDAIIENSDFFENDLPFNPVLMGLNSEIIAESDKISPNLSLSVSTAIISSFVKTFLSNFTIIFKESFVTGIIIVSNSLQLTMILPLSLFRFRTKEPSFLLV